jgi:myo-inositol-1(or 4)-monophosphatase
LLGTLEDYMIDRNTLERARDVAAEAAVRAGRLISMHAGRIEPEDIRSKGVHDLVTEADEEAQRIIVEALQAAFPDHGILAEEGSDPENLVEVADGYRWIIDPIDGTTNFTRGLAPYAVSIALQYEAEIVVGTVLDVPRGELFTAVKGGGLYVNGVRSRVSRTRTLHDSLITTGLPYRDLSHLEPYLQVLADFLKLTNGVRRPGSAAVDLANVAAGRFDGFFEEGLAPWDLAAGLLLVEEGGGCVTDFSNRRNPIFCKQLVASNGLIHQAMLGVVEPLREFDRSRVPAVSF